MTADQLPTLRLIGVGMCPQRHCTLGAVRQMQAASLVLHTAFPGSALFFESISVASARDVTSLYRDGGFDVDNYRTIEAEILAATAEHGDVAFLESGHPFLGVTSSRQLALDCARAGIRMLVEPGISSIDTIMADLRVDLLERGTAVVDANRLLLLRMGMSPTMGYLVYHVSSVGTSATHFSDPAERNRLDLLIDHLEQFLPSDGAAVLVRSAGRPDESAHVLETTIDGLRALRGTVDYGTSLYLPPGPITEYDREFLERLRAGTIST